MPESVTRSWNSVQWCFEDMRILIEGPGWFLHRHGQRLHNTYGCYSGRSNSHKWWDQEYWRLSLDERNILTDWWIELATLSSHLVIKVSDTELPSGECSERQWCAIWWIQGPHHRVKLVNVMDDTDPSDLPSDNRIEQHDLPSPDCSDKNLPAIWWMQWRKPSCHLVNAVAKTSLTSGESSGQLATLIAHSDRCSGTTCLASDEFGGWHLSQACHRLMY